MPIPQPKESESIQDFLVRCMSDEIMITEYSDTTQRYAVCSAQLSSKKHFVNT